SDSALDDFIHTVECSAEYKEDVFRIYLDGLLVRVFSAALWRYTCSRAFQNLEQRLLYTFTLNISCNGCVLAFTCNLIDLIDVDDSLFRTLYIKVCSLDQTQKNVFYIISDIACLSETCRIRNRKWNVKRSCQSLSEQCFTTAGRTD